MQADVWLHRMGHGLRETADDLLVPWRRLPDLSQAIGASDLSRSIVTRQFRTLMHELPFNVLAALVGTLLWCAALWSIQPGWNVVLWATSALMTLLPVAVLGARFAREQPTDGALRVWEQRIGQVCCLNGVMWGSVGFAFPAAAAQFAPYAAIGLLLVLAGSVSLFVAYRPGISWIAAPCALLTSIWLVLSGGALRIAIGLGLCVAVALLMRLARVQNTLMTQAMRAAEERQGLLEELELRRREAEQANLAKTRFLATVSHDLRQPMHSISLLSGALRQRSSDQTGVVGQIGASVQAMDDMLGALLEVSKLDDGTLPLQVAPFPLGPLFERIALQFAAQAQAKGIALQVVPCTARVVSDAFQLQRMLANLVSNAIRYTPHGRVVLRCRLRAGGAWVQVWDSGLGIAREHRARVFEEFFQVARTSHRGAEGLGLGLSIVQRLAQRLNHRLVLRSRPARGSMFALWVPLDSTPALSTEAANREAQLAALLAGQLVLLIDDDAVVLKSMKTLLEAFQCHVLVAHSTASALKVVDDSLRTPDLIVSDFRLGELDTGFDAITQVRIALDESIPALLVTAEIGLAPHEAARSLGCSLLPKPLQTDDFVRALSAPSR